MALSFIPALIGLVVFPIAYIWRKDTGRRVIYTQDGRVYKHQEWHLPGWAKWFDNASLDGIYGDTHGNNYSFRKGKEFGTSLIDAYWFSAIRNPANYFKRNVMGVKGSDLNVKWVGSKGMEADTYFKDVYSEKTVWRLTWDGWRVGLRIVYPKKSPTFWYFNLGFKFKPKIQIDPEKYYGFTYRISRKKD